MKKFIGAICSAVAGILTFIMLSLNWIATKTTTTVLGSSKTTKGGYSGWELISNKVGDSEQVFSDANGYLMHRIFAIITLVLAIVLIIMAIILLLQSFKILKVKANLNIINCMILTLFVISIIVAIIGVALVSKDISSGLDLVLLSGETKASIGVGAWLQLAFSVIACGCGWALARKAK